MAPPSTQHAAPRAHEPRPGTPSEVFWAFLKLGLTSFGGPVAHLGYFRHEFVERRKWLDDKTYSDLVALCQFLPGPASSQLGMALGQQRAGWAGSLLAWAGFTMPSALLLVAFAYGVGEYTGTALSGALHGLKVVAVAVVAQAVWGMAQTLCPDRTRVALALVSAALALLLPNWQGQLAAVLLCGLLGWRTVKLAHEKPVKPSDCGVSRQAGLVALLVFATCLLGLPLVVAATGSPFWGLVEGFYRSGALVFGGGHVVLPMLQAVVVPPGVVGNSEFLMGYGATQAAPGPLFAFAAYLGASMNGPLTGWQGGLVFLLVIFLPTWLLVIGALPFWHVLRQEAALRNAMAGVNAGVVGILLSALYDPVWTSAIHGLADFGLALAAFGLLVFLRTSPVTVVFLGSAAGVFLHCLNIGHC